MGVKLALQILDPALQRDNGAAARHDLTCNSHLAGLDDYRTDELGGGFV
jgi:hypothetical protein